MPGKIHKRYSEMSSLKHKLEMAYPSLMHDVPFPPKRIVGNFSPTTLSCRSKAFEKFLTYIFSVKELRFSKPFIRFLYGNSLLEGYRLIENGLYERASDMLVSSWKLQNKVCLYFACKQNATGLFQLLKSLMLCSHSADRAH